MTRLQQRMQVALGQELRQNISAFQLQSLQLLTLPIQDLEAHVEECLLNNPLLEMENERTEREEGLILAAVLQEGSAYRENAGRQTALPEDLLLAGDFRSAELSLRDLLRLQTAVLGLSASREYAVKCLISALDADGYLRLDDVELCQAFSLPKESIAPALRILQSMEPRGVGARNLGECLLLQTPENHPLYELAEVVSRDFLPELAASDYRRPARALNVPEGDIRKVFGLLRSLNPYPAACLDGEERSSYIVPDILVEPEGGTWRLRLNDQVYAGVGINPYYENLNISQLDDAQLQDYFRQHMREARELLYALRRRHDTLLHLAGLLFRFQVGFLHLGPIGLKPFTMLELADLAKCHPSTVSRAAAGKYIQTPRGIYPWTYFFPHPIPTSAGRFTTDTYVRMRIGQMIEQEERRKPLSDQKLQERLQEEGICIARRTVAKYRQDCAFPPSRLRRRLE
ncbi:MAG: RNA polymerase factor sigma-54 [Bacillota bacterium]|nr:RNA polymerase factor sigma-54 [Bacillota bacterium]